MKRKELIEELEQRFFQHQNEFDNAEYGSEKRRVEAELTCEICDILGLINNTSFDQEMERLFDKFNLWRREDK